MSVLQAALIGKNIAHSISPRVHEEIFALLAGRSGSRFTSLEYSIHDCDERCNLADWLKKAKNHGMCGANVTIPFKADAYSLVDETVGSAVAIESVNTIAFNGKTRGTSTDGEGFLSALLREHPEFNLEKYHLICIGAGSTSRAVLYSLCTRWMPKTLTIVNRTPEHAQELANFCIAQAPGPTVQIMSFDELINSYSESPYRLVLQTTPVGNITTPGNLTDGFVWNELDFAIDLTYRPLDTAFLKSAHEAGAKTMNGLGMLIEQAALSQFYWHTGKLASTSPLEDAEYFEICRRLTNELM